MFSGEPPGIPEPPQVDLHPGRSQMAMARARLALRSFRVGWAIFVESRIGVLSLATIVLFALMAISHPILMATVWDAEVYDPVTGYAFDRLEHPSPPNWRHPLGTDPLGRDVLSQLLSSTRSEFVLGITAALVTVGIATTVGAVAAYYGGLVDALFMRLADLIIALPGISLLIVLSALFQLNLFYLALIIGVLGGFGGTAIILKSQALSIRVKPYIEAARVAGGGHFHIIFVHIIPNLLPLSLLYMMFTVTGAHLRRGGAVLPGPAGPADELGHHDPHRQHRRLPAGRHPVLVAHRTGRRVNHLPVQRVLPGGPRPGRGGQPQAAAAYRLIANSSDEMAISNVDIDHCRVHKL